MIKDTKIIVMPNTTDIAVPVGNHLMLRPYLQKLIDEGWRAVATSPVEYKSEFQTQFKSMDVTLFIKV